MWVLARNLWEILKEFGEILGKYRILDDSSLGSKGISMMGSRLCKKCPIFILLCV